MKQAQVLSERDIKLMLGHPARSAYPARNRCMFLLMLYSGMRVGEIAALNKGDLVSTDGRMREQIQLKAH
jgi:integrase